jgi:hypothetical protein
MEVLTSRTAGDGFIISLDFEPSLEEREKSVVRITHFVTGDVIDSIEGKPEEGFDVYSHPAFYSDAYAAVLTPDRADSELAKYDPDLRVTEPKKKKKG